MKPRPFNLHPSSFILTRSAFTLIELMISIAIVLILMLGINFVFSTSAKTVSTGMALSTVGRDMRNARKVMENDFNNAVTAEEMPALLIHSEWVYAWRDRRDKLADYDANLPGGGPHTYDVDGDQGNGDEINLANPIYDGVYNFRRHRQDRFSFFVRNSNNDYTRQTGDQSSYFATDTSPEAWISYGLLRLADNSNPGSPSYGRYWKPGARNLTGPLADQDERGNPNNFFASQWVLGRRLMLLKDLNQLAVNSTFFPGYPAVASSGLQFGNEASKVQTKNPPLPPTVIDFIRENPPYPNTDQWQIQEGRADLVATTLADLRTYFAVNVPGWADADPTTNAAGTNRDWRTFQTAAPAAATINYLHWAKTFVDKSQNSNANAATAMAWQTRETALTTPVFVNGCTQFIIEFAGDFYDQGPTLAAPTVPEPLGTIDYVETGLAGGPRQMRWYGMPRDVDGDGTLDVRPVSGTGPLAWATPGTPRWNAAVGAFEHQNTPGAPFIWSWGPTVSGGNPKLPTAPPWTTTVANQGNFNNVRPSLIRITMELSDPNGRLEDGQRIEFVFPLK